MCIAPTRSTLLWQGWEEEAGGMWSSRDLSWG